MLLHFLFRIGALFSTCDAFATGEGRLLKSLAVLVHGALSWSSLLLPLPQTRNSSAPMIWPEFRSFATWLGMVAYAIVVWTQRQDSVFLFFAGLYTPVKLRLKYRMPKILMWCLYVVVVHVGYPLMIEQRVASLNSHVLSYVIHIYMVLCVAMYVAPMVLSYVRAFGLLATQKS